MSLQIKSIEDLKERLKTDSGKVLLRAINDAELEYLLTSGSENFTFNKGTNYEIGYENFIGNMVAREVRRRRSGTIILIPLTEYSSHFEERTWPVCKETFRGQVEVFNLEDRGEIELKEYLG
ncbi:MAG: hypothetical protein AABX11_02880 [Nanoarchaeota archaeon]